MQKHPEFDDWLKCGSCGYCHDFKGSNELNSTKKANMSISMQEILMGRAQFQDLPKDYQDNLMDLLEKINKVRDAYGKPMIVNSGYRTPAINEATANSGKNSWHMKCAAVDISDIDGSLWKWTINNLDLMKELGLWMEDKRWTPTWTHYQIYAPNSGHRIFIPNSNPASAPQTWDGQYDHQFD